MPESTKKFIRDKEHRAKVGKSAAAWIRRKLKHMVDHVKHEAKEFHIAGAAVNFSAVRWAFARIFPLNPFGDFSLAWKPVWTHRPKTICHPSPGGLGGEDFSNSASISLRMLMGSPMGC